MSAANLPNSSRRNTRDKRNLARNRRTHRRRSGRRRVSSAKGSLRKFRQATLLAVIFTTLLLMLLPSGDAESQDNDLPDTVAIIDEIAVDELVETVEEDEEELAPAETVSEALITLREMVASLYRNLPRFGIALVLLLVAWMVTKGVKYVFRKISKNKRRNSGIVALTTIVVWLVAISMIFGVLSGDIRALVGSLGLLGLALSWALQTPIESFTGWLLNSFQGYYRIGDRVVVGEVFGDVYKIDFLTTTVWETGGPERMGFVNAEQPTGRLVTFPNNEVLAGSVINLTRDFPFVWDEVTVQVSDESDLRLAMEVLFKVASDLLGDHMKGPARKYGTILQKAGLAYEGIPENPQVFFNFNESWTDTTLRYLVNARERRKWKSRLVLAITEEFGKPEYNGKISFSYNRNQVQFLNHHPDIS
ncbi:mechanosensitive ion channel [Cytophagaceae bacterium ABcell3]|nr:mechanosensitive ion channel [Cytophagaceae bacterium ABcell3]